MPVLNRIASYAEEMKGWRRHLHVGFSAADTNPLQSILRDNYLENPAAGP